MATGHIAKTCLIGLLLLAPAARSATRYVAEPQLEAVRQWSELESKVQHAKIDRKEAQAKFKALWPKVIKDEVRSERVGLWQWVFPLPGHGEEDFSGESYDVDGYRFYDGPSHSGHPGLKLFVRDRRRRGLDDRTGQPAPVVSATDGVVVGAQKFWEPQDNTPLGIYVCVLDLETKLFFYYACLSALKVSPGQLVSKGEVLGAAGRTGRDAMRYRLGTHLRFEVHSFDDALFYPVYPGRKLREAEHREFPLKTPDYSRPPKGKKDK
jgi:murein DD-endopeptidase MepM/ murein hydrolase activator NlpD